jgi:hypothetical protein
MLVSSHSPNRLIVKNLTIGDLLSEVEFSEDDLPTPEYYESEIAATVAGLLYKFPTGTLVGTYLDESNTKYNINIVGYDKIRFLHLFVNKNIKLSEDSHLMPQHRQKTFMDLSMEDRNLILQKRVDVYLIPHEDDNAHDFFESVMYYHFQ